MRGDSPNAEREIIAAARTCVERVQFAVDAMDDCLDVVFGRVGDEDRKFVPTHPPKDVGLAKRVSEYVRGVQQGTVSFLVAEGVIDLLHAVEIDKQDQERPSRAMRQLDVMLRKSQQAPPVVESG